MYKKSLTYCEINEYFKKYNFKSKNNQMILNRNTKNKYK